MVLVGLVLAACAPAATPTSAPVAAPTSAPVIVTSPPQVVVVTPTAVPGRTTLVVALARAPLTLDPADHRQRETETVIRDMYDGLVTRDTESGVHLDAESFKWLTTRL
jgi:peptide/nickel transport system substrate-binding protein